MAQTAAFAGPVAVLILGVLIYRGRLSPRTFAAVPVRRTGMGPMDLLAVFGALLLGISLAGLAARSLGLTGGEAPPTAGEVLTMILTQVLMFGPAVALLVVLAAVAPQRERVRPEPRGQAASDEHAEPAGEPPPGAEAMSHPDQRPAGTEPAGDAEPDLLDQGSGWAAFGLSSGRPGRDGARGLLALLIVLPLVYVAILAAQALALWWQQPLDQIGHELLQRFLDADSPRTLGLLCVATIIVGPILEELVFRGLLQSAVLGLLGRNRRWLGILITSAIFTATHLQVAWYALPGLMVLSVMLGYLYERHHSLIPAITLHAGFNAVNVGLVVVTLGP